MKSTRIQKTKKPHYEGGGENLPPVQRDKRPVDQIRKHIQEALDELDEAIRDGD